MQFSLFLLQSFDFTKTTVGCNQTSIWVAEMSGIASKQSVGVGILAGKILTFDGIKIAANFCNTETSDNTQLL